MRLRTFSATYLLFMFILFFSVGLVSIYLTNSQIEIIRDKGISQFQSISSSLSREIALLTGREVNLSEDAWHAAVQGQVRGYSRLYSRHGVQLTVTDMNHHNNLEQPDPVELSFLQRDNRHYISISAVLAEPFSNLLLEYNLDISDSIHDMQRIQHRLLTTAIACAVITAFALHFILSTIFRPLDIVAIASRKIAQGQFQERIPVSCSGDLAQVAHDFNQMAERVQVQIRQLEDDASNKQLFVDNFAHEIRTPLTTILGYAEYLQKANLAEEEIIDSATLILNEAKHMRGLANSLLELATLRSYEAVKTEVNLYDLFADIGQVLATPARESRVDFSWHSELETIEGQDDLLRSLLLNLCKNALQACSPEHGEIKLLASVDQGVTLISVKDNGCGIPQSSLNKIIEPFYRVDGSRNRADGSTGLGLALCKQIAAVHGAEMMVTSEVGVGTTVEVRFTLP